jgi:hypothetical protein
MFRQRYAQLRANKCALWLVGGNGDGRAFLALAENLKQQLGAAPVELPFSWPFP